MSRLLSFFVVLAFAANQWFVGECCGQDNSGSAPIVVRVLVLNFDPIVPDQQQRLHEVGQWNDPRQLAEGYAADVKAASGGLLQYEMVKWRDIDAFPVKQDGFQYTMERYLACRDGKAEWHQHDLADYPKLVQDHGAVEMINADKVDEIWIFGGPYFGYHESSMLGPGAFYINGGIYDRVAAKRPFVVMGFNYERGVAEMLHNLSHRTEATMSRVYGGWKSEELTSDWARFAANLTQSGEAAVGSCHYPPNALSDYDYANERVVQSTAEDWLNYPHLTGRKSSVSRETWGGPDYHRNYMKWWFGHLPRAEGTNSEGKLNNWWRYLFEFANTVQEAG